MNLDCNDTVCTRMKGADGGGQASAQCAPSVWRTTGLISL